MDSNAKLAETTSLLIKVDPNSPVLKVIGRDGVVVKPGTVFTGFAFDDFATVAMPPDGLAPGTDYFVSVADDRAIAFCADGLPTASCIGGFHYAPGGNASARSGGDDIPAINPCSLWDRGFRPACADPRGMALVEYPDAPFWCDIYLTGVNHPVDGTSKFGVTIADGNDCPKNPTTRKAFKRFDYETANAVMTHHGKSLLSYDEFRAAAFGVTEKSVRTSDPKITGLDHLRTSKFGLMQATGNLWVWGHDGDPDTPRASILGGSWFHDGYAGSRYANVDRWADYSAGNLGARGRSDHLQPE